MNSKIKTEIGHYSVNNKIYANKLDAILNAMPNKDDVKWHFFDEQLSKANWTVEPAQTLDELYAYRAKQIREKYDYIIVFCSGGADSTNVIKTFINNNIRVNEIMALAPKSGLKNWNFNKSNIDESNTISETEFALFPLLKDISRSNPEIKITVNDFFEDIIKYNDVDWTYQACGNIVTVLTSHFTNVNKFPHIRALLDAGKKIGLIYGTDKPIFRISDSGGLFIVLADSGINYLNMPEHREHENLDRVLFYWTADLPEIMIKQGHVIKKMIELPFYQHFKNYFNDSDKVYTLESFENFLNEKHNKETVLNSFISKKILQTSLAYNNKSLYQRTIVPWIYPSTYNPNLFQCQKVDANAGFFTSDQAWLHILHKGSRISDMVTSGVKSLYNLIHPKYLNGNGTGFLTYIKSYKIGELDKG